MIRRCDVAGGSVDVAHARSPRPTRRLVHDLPTHAPSRRFVPDIRHKSPWPPRRLPLIQERTPQDRGRCTPPAVSMSCLLVTSLPPGRCRGEPPCEHAMWRVSQTSNPSAGRKALVFRAFSGPVAPSHPQTAPQTDLAGRNAHVDLAPHQPGEVDFRLAQVRQVGTVDPAHPAVVAKVNDMILL